MYGAKKNDRQGTISEVVSLAIQDKNMSYFIINNSDGDTYVEKVDRNELLNRLNDREYYGYNVNFLDKIPNDDTNYWRENDILIIKGKILVPKPKTVIKEFEFD